VLGDDAAASVGDALDGADKSKDEVKLADGTVVRLTNVKHVTQLVQAQNTVKELAAQVESNTAGGGNGSGSGNSAGGGNSASGGGSTSGGSGSNGGNGGSQPAAVRARAPAAPPPAATRTRAVAAPPAA